MLAQLAQPYLHNTGQRHDDPAAEIGLADAVESRAGHDI